MGGPGPKPAGRGRSVMGSFVWRERRLLVQEKTSLCLTPSLLSAQDSPTNKLLYAKEIPEYLKIVQRYYKQIHDMTPLSEQEMNAHLAEESRVRPALWGPCRAGWGRGGQDLTVSEGLRISSGSWLGWAWF